MVTSRTGTTAYLRNRKRVIARARADGLTHCPGYVDAEGVHHPCGRELDYGTPNLPNSAEVDHIVEHRYGGDDEIANLRVLCRAQNLARNRTRTPVPVPDAAQFPISRDWFAPVSPA